MTRWGASCWLQRAVRLIEFGPRILLVIRWKVNWHGSAVLVGLGGKGLKIPCVMIDRSERIVRKKIVKKLVKYATRDSGHRGIMFSVDVTRAGCCQVKCGVVG